MQYMGGKGRIGGQIAEVIRRRESLFLRYTEPFVGGGGALFSIAPLFRGAVRVNDAHAGLISMHEAIHGGWSPPTEVSWADYQWWRRQPESPSRAFVEFACSNRGRSYGGYARAPSDPLKNYAELGARSLARGWARLAGRDVMFTAGDFSRLTVAADDVIYCDPPYEGTQGYGGVWNARRFWEWATHAAVALRASVYVSESRAPDDWVPIWEKERTNRLNGEWIREALYVHKSQR